jgi:hypothetical protein
MLAGSALVACFDEKDFKFDKFTISDLDPTLYIPLVNDTVRLDVSGDYNVLYDKEGVGYLHFDIEDDILPPVEDFFEVPAATLTISDVPFYYSGTPSLIDPVISPVKYPFSSPDQRIDSIVFKGGILTLGMPSLATVNGSYTVTIPELKKNDTPFSASFASSHTENLSGYILRFENDNDNGFNIKFELDMRSSSALAGDYTFNATVSFVDVEKDGVYGYFGQHSETYSVTVNDISTFNKFRNNGNTDLRIKEAFLDFHVDNGAGFPIQLRIDEVESTTSSGTEMKAKVDSVTIFSNKLGESYYTDKKSIGGEALGEVLSNMPSEVKFNFSAMINPGGNTEKNFLTGGASITVSDIKARIPLNFSVKDMVLKDTLNFSSSKMTFEDMELFMNVENNMPVEIALEAYLMDENNNVNPDPLFKTPVSIPAATVDAATGRVTAPYPYEKKIEANVESLAQTKKIKVKVTVNTGNSASQYVRVTKDNYVYLRIGAKAKVNIDKID